MRSLICALAALSLAGCVTMRGPIPTELLQDCLVGSELKVATNAELSDTAAKLAATLRQCNLDKKGLREWAGS